MKLARIVFPVVLLVAASASLFAQAPASTATPPGATPGTTSTAAAGDKGKALAPADKKFVKDAGESLYYQLALVEKTKLKAGSEAVKKLGERMNDDLKKVWEELAAATQPLNEPLPTALAGGDKSAAERLNKLEGDRFDRQVLTLLSKESKRLARTFETKSLQNAALKTLAANHGPTVKNHSNEIDKAEKEAAKTK